MRLATLCLLIVGCAVSTSAPELGAEGSDAAALRQDAGAAPAEDAGVEDAQDAGVENAVPQADPPDCETNADCPEGDVCRSGECRAVLHGCASSNDCHEGAVCAPGSHVCVEPCREDYDCPEGAVCAHIGVCLVPCEEVGETVECPEGTICKQNRRTADFPFCGLDDEGLRCGPGGTCPAGYGCDPETGRCDEEFACASDRDCDEGQLCNIGTGRCHDAATSCATDRDCDEDMICHRELRRCTPVDFCETHWDCGMGERCHPVLERCMTRCQDARHCDEGQTCRDYWCVDE